MDNNVKINDLFFDDIRKILSDARKKAFAAINFTMVGAYWEIGRRIFEEKQNGKERADYGSYLIKELSRKLTKDIGKGFDAREVRRIRQFYIVFPFRDSLRPELSWSHYRSIFQTEEELSTQIYPE